MAAHQRWESNISGIVFYVTHVLFRCCSLVVILVAFGSGGVRRDGRRWRQVENCYPGGGVVRQPGRQVTRTCTSLVPLPSFSPFAVSLGPTIEKRSGVGMCAVFVSPPTKQTTEVHAVSHAGGRPKVFAPGEGSAYLFLLAQHRFICRVLPLSRRTGYTRGMLSSLHRARQAIPASLPHRHYVPPDLVSRTFVKFAMSSFFFALAVVPVSGRWLVASSSRFGWRGLCRSTSHR